MVCAPVRSIIPELKLGDYLSVQAHKPCSISHLYQNWWKSVLCSLHVIPILCGNPQVVTILSANINSNIGYLGLSSVISLFVKICLFIFFCAV